LSVKLSHSDLTEGYFKLFLIRNQGSLLQAAYLGSSLWEEIAKRDVALGSEQIGGR